MGKKLGRKHWLGMEADGEWVWRKREGSRMPTRFPALMTVILLIEIENKWVGAGVLWSRKMT